ncbi:MAG TPA: cytochrome c-type biogenesis protein [Caulobacteraceae bacterium]|jgi:cytochrome c-type biogenesis protein CcmH
MRGFVCALAAAVIAAGPACAVLPSEQLHDPKLEARARHIGEGLRCLVCQNETIDESDAPLAHDLRVILRQRLLAGDSDRQAVDYIVARYGHFVLMKPPFEAQTLLLWLGPFLVIVLGAVGLGLMARSSARADDEVAPLTSEETDLLKRRLEGEDGP